MRIAAIAAGLFIAVALAAYIWPHRPPAFDSVRWRDTALPAAVRLQMADDLIRTHRLDGLHRDEVVALLGEPPKTPYFKEYDLVYLLGPERGFISIDSEWLVVKFGPDGRAKARIVRD